METSILSTPITFFPSKTPSQTSLSFTTTTPFLKTPTSTHKPLTTSLRIRSSAIEKERIETSRPDTFLREGDAPADKSVRFRFEKMIRDAQDSICAAIQAADGGGKFKEDVWSRPGGGGGISRVLQKGGVWEKAGVNVSVVYGIMPPEAYRAAKGENSTTKAGPIPFFAAGISSVLHPKNPFAPTLHFNYRYFETDAPEGQCFSCLQYGHHSQDCSHEKTSLIAKEAREKEEDKIHDKTAGCTLLEIDQLPEVHVLPDFDYGDQCYDVHSTSYGSNKVWGKFQQSRSGGCEGAILLISPAIADPRKLVSALPQKIVVFF